MPYRPVEAERASSYEPTLPEPEQEAWRVLAPEVREVAIESSADGREQPLLFYDSGTQREKPLLVVLHSWSSTHWQSLNVPYARFAEQNDWVFVQPEFRGTNEKPEATASDLAVQDVVDAVAYAKSHARIDDARVYVTGYSGGGMMALVMAGRHPELWAGVVAWSPVVDLVDWYAHNRERGHARYAREIAASCGGAPRPRTPAREECRKRSPLAVLEEARGAPFPIFIGHGIDDETVAPSHALWAYNLLADEQERFSQADIRFIASRHALPRRLRTATQEAARAEVDALHYMQSSANVRLALFEGGHDIHYNAGLRWLSEARRE